MQKDIGGLFDLNYIFYLDGFFLIGYLVYLQTTLERLTGGESDNSGLGVVFFVQLLYNICIRFGK